MRKTIVKNHSLPKRRLIVPIFCGLIVISQGVWHHVYSQKADFGTLLEKGKSEFKNENYPEAAKYFEQAEKLNPHNQEVHYFLGYTYERMSAKDAADMLKESPSLNQKASEQFKKVIAIAPMYQGELVILDPYSKLTAVWGTMAMAYLVQGKPDSALWAFKYGQSLGGYVPALLEYNRNTMRSCESNAILFTNGDNDTFPMWFLQAVEGFRKDITVVNLSMLNTSWYIKQLQNAYPLGPNNLVIRLSESQIDALEAITWQEKAISIPVANDTLNQEGSITWQLKPTLWDQGLRVQDLMVLRIIEDNKWMRPIYFSVTVDRENRIGLDQYLPMEGLVFRLRSHQAGRYSKNHLAKNCLENYTYDGLHDSHLKYSPDIQGIYSNYQSIFASLALTYYKDEEIDRAKHCLETMLDKIPDRIIPYNEQLLDWVKQILAME